MVFGTGKRASGQRKAPRWAWGSLLAAVPFLAWVTTAVHVQLAPHGWGFYLIAAVMAALVAWGSTLGAARAWAVLGLMVLVAAVAWSQIRPVQGRDWAPELKHGVTARMEGAVVRLSGIRDFHWRTPTDGDARWIETTVDLDDLQTVDFISTVWDSPHLAHTMISFGFADGQYVAFSAEIRREKHESFSELGGFFKQFELVLIGATEEDIVRLRTHARGEDVSIFPLTMTPDQRKALFLSYVDLGNQLARKPRFYQTVTTNCTTVIWRLARTVAPGLPLDWRVLLSGHTQDYLYDLGVISNDRLLGEHEARGRVTALAREMPDDKDYSRWIRSRL